MTTAVTVSVTTILTDSQVTLPGLEILNVKPYSPLHATNPTRDVSKLAAGVGVGGGVNTGDEAVSPVTVA